MGRASECSATLPSWLPSPMSTVFNFVTQVTTLYISHCNVVFKNKILILNP
jgi:hypothetical protein